MFEDIIKDEPKIKIIHELCMEYDIHKCRKFTSKFNAKNMTWDYKECQFRELTEGAFNKCLKKTT